MGFFGVGQRSIGSRHIRDYAVVDRTIGSDAVTTSKIAPDTIIEVDIAPGAIGSHLIAADAISYADQIKDNIIGSQHLESDSIYNAKIQAGAIGSREIAANAISYADQIKDNIIGSNHLGPDSVYSIKIQSLSIGSRHLDTGAVGYEDIIANNLIGFGKITAGLQGSLAGGVAIESGRIGSLIYYNAAYVEESKGVVSNPSSMTLTEKSNRMWIARYTTSSMYEYNPFTGSLINTVSVPNANIWGMDFASDTHRLWGVQRYGQPKYIWEFGTTTGAAIGSIRITDTIGTKELSLIGLAIDSDYDLYILNSTRGYIYKMGTIGNVIGSIKNTSAKKGLGWDPVHKQLWSTNGASNVLMIGTTTGNIIGTFQFLAGNTLLDTKWDTNIDDLWVCENDTNSIYRVPGYDTGEYVQFSAPFALPPTVVASQFKDKRDLGVHIQEPTVGSFRVDAAPGTLAKVMWIAVGV